MDLLLSPGHLDLGYRDTHVHIVYCECEPRIYFLECEAASMVISESFSSERRAQPPARMGKLLVRVCGADAGRLRRFVGHLFFGSRLSN